MDPYNLEIKIVVGVDVVYRVEYSNNASAVYGITLPSTAYTGSTTLIVPVSTAYPYLRLVWVSGTATSVDTTLLGEMIS